MSQFEVEVKSILRNQSTPRDSAVTLYDLLTPSEKLNLLDGDYSPYGFLFEILKSGYNGKPIKSGEIKRIGLPGLKFSDGPRGCVMGYSTAFPVSSTRAASFDTELEKEVGKAMGRETISQGANLFAGICINLARHPKWGRAQESYGEDPLILGAMGSALSQGVRHTGVMSCAKHFALNSMEVMRFLVNVKVDEGVLHECYFPHFLRVVEEGGAESLMSAYNSINGKPCGDSDELLNGVVRDTWKREDIFVISDFMWGMRDAAASVRAGLDVELPMKNIRARKLEKALKRGEVDWKDVDRIGKRLIEAQLRYYARIDGIVIPPPSVVGCDDHRKLAKRVAVESMVLLKNTTLAEGQPLLPLKRNSQTIAIIGKLAETTQTGDHGSSYVRDETVVSILEGMKLEKDKDIKIVYDDGSKVSRSVKVAVEADMVIMVVGYTHQEEGEYVFNDDPSINQGSLPGIPGTWPVTHSLKVGMSILKKVKDLPGGDRVSLRLPKREEDLVERIVGAVGTKSIMAIQSSGAVMLPPSIQDKIGAILFIGYGGCRIGTAFAEVVFGDAEPSGRLPFIVPASEDHLPELDMNAREVEYDRFWGYRLLHKKGVKATYPFGFGLGYGSVDFVPGSMVAPATLEGRFFEVKVDVKNVGPRSTAAVVQVYGGLKDAQGDGYTRVLLGFSKVTIQPGDVETIKVDCRSNPMARWNKSTKGFDVAAGDYRLWVSRYEGDERSEVKTVASSGFSW